MAVSATLSVPTLSTAPGKAVGCEVLLVNGGSASEAVALEIVGPAGEWACAVPPRLVLAPGGEARARLIFTVPLVPPSSTTFTVRVSGATAAGPTGSIDVTEVQELRVAVRPMIARARRSSRHTVTVANHGNVALRAALTATGPDAAIALRLADEVVAVGPGHEVSVDLDVAARRPRLARQVQAHRLSVVATAVGAAAPTGAAVDACAEAVFFQEPLRWRTPVLAALAVAVAVAVLLVWRPGGSPAGVGAGPEVSLRQGPAAVPPSNCGAVAADGPQILIATFAYCPPGVSVAVGTEVRWRNDDAAPHTVTSSGPGPLDSGVLTQGQSFALRFEQPGTYEYLCTLHPGMLGTIVVTA